MSILNLGEFPSVPSRGIQDLDSDEEPDDVQIQRSYELDETVGKPLENVELLIVTNSKLSSDFVNVYIDHQRLQQEDNKSMGQIKLIETTSVVNKENQGEVDEKKVAAIGTIKLIGGKNSAAVCHCHFSMEPHQDSLNDLTEKIFQSFNSPKLTVVVLTSRNLVQYQKNSNMSDSELPEYLTRGLKTSCWTDPSPCQRLEQPNIVGGIPAAILTEREFGGKPCYLIVNYTEVDTTDSITLKGFHDSFFRLAPVKACASLKTLPAKESIAKLKKLVEEEDQGNIFM